MSNNGMYGTIRMHQQKRYPKSPSGTHIVNPEFAAFAESYGGFGATVHNQAKFVSALDRARAANKPCILD